MDKKLTDSDIWDTDIKKIPLSPNPHCAKFTGPPPPPFPFTRFNLAISSRKVIGTVQH